MTDKISQPGIYDAIPADFYHGQLTVHTSISRSMAHDLVTTCPMKAWHGSYLNPDHKPKAKKEFDLGHAGHLIVLEPDQWDAFVVDVDAADYKTKAAQEARDAAHDAGKIPLLPKHKTQILGMRDALLRHPLAAKAFTGGRAEQTIVAMDPETGIWLKARADYLRPGMMIDFKTTGNSHPDEFAKRVWDQGYYIQDPWYRFVHELATGEPVDTFLYVVQEVDAPHCVSINRIKDVDAQWGMMQMRRAINLFAECLASNNWPDYGTEINEISMPAYAHYALADLHGAGRLTPHKPSRALLQQAAKFQAPLAHVREPAQ